jgi:hypothetical protein
MSIPLADALSNVNLEAGHIYQCRVGSLLVEVRVEDSSCGALPSPIQPADLMLDPWTDLPAPPVRGIVAAVSASPVLPDPPVIPSDSVQQ